MKIGTDRIVISIEVEMAPPPKKMAWNQWVPRGVSNPKKLRLFHWWWSHTCCRRWGEGGLQKAQVAIASKWVHQTPKLAYPQSHTQCGGKVLAKVSKIEAQWILSPMYCHCCWWYVLTTAWCGIPPRFVVVLAAWFVVFFVVRGNGSFLLAHLFIFLVEMPAWFLEKNKSRDFFGGSKIKIISAFVSKKNHTREVRLEWLLRERCAEGTGASLTAALLTAGSIACGGSFGASKGPEGASFLGNVWMMMIDD